MPTNTHCRSKAVSRLLPLGVEPLINVDVALPSFPTCSVRNSTLGDIEKRNSDS